MNKEHLDILLQIEHEAQGPVGRNVLNFGTKVQNIEVLPVSLNQQLDRANLQQVCLNKEFSNLAVTIAILAWGGMRFSNARRLFSNWNHLEPIIEQIRRGKIERRSQAFEILQTARKDGELPGLGIGYFTKIICFLNPKLNGYILDQWTGKSINLIWDEPIVNITSAGWVNDNNNSKVYEIFCQHIETLSETLNCKPIDAEERIFSVGGKNPGQWRAYLKSKYPQCRA